MTREEALSKATYEDIEYLRFGNEVQMVRPSEAYEAMEIFAKEVAIDFSEWNCKGLWSTSNGMWYPYQDEDNPITGEKLYDLYLQYKNK